MGINAYVRAELAGALAEKCSECEGSGEIDCGRDWQKQRCERCDGSGEEPEQDEADYLADQADALNDEAALWGEA